MQTVGAIAFWAQFQACATGAFELRTGLRRERWGWGQSGSVEFKLLKHVEGNGDSVGVNVYIVFNRVRMRARLGMCICARTTARIRQHADEDNKEQDKKIPRQTNLYLMVDGSAWICVCVFSCVMTACVTDPCAYRL